MPGLKADELTINILEDVVTIEGEIKQDENEYLMRELPVGNFRRSLRLPTAVNADKAEAKITDGVLTLRPVPVERLQALGVTRGGFTLTVTEVKTAVTLDLTWPGEDGLFRTRAEIAAAFTALGLSTLVLHPDAVFDTDLWTPEMLARRAARYGLSVAEYRKRNLLRCEVTAADVGALVAALASDLFAKTTGAQIPVDGGSDRVI